MILLDDKTNSNIELNSLQDICNYLNITQDIELIIVNNSEIKELNKNTRGVDKETDVLSFPLEAIEHTPLGSIVISIDKAKELAKNLGHSLQDELALLFTHGLLHLLGYDHEIDNGEMRQKEQEILEHFNLPQSLIVRTQGE